MSDRLTVDPEALRNGGVNIQATVNLAVAICRELFAAAEENRGAGGTGEMGEKFDKGYRPGEEHGLKFLRLLEKTIGETGTRTLQTAGVFTDAVNDADAAVRP